MGNYTSEVLQENSHEESFRVREVITEKKNLGLVAVHTSKILYYKTLGSLQFYNVCYYFGIKSVTQHTRTTYTTQTTFPFTLSKLVVLSCRVKPEINKEFIQVHLDVSQVSRRKETSKKIRFLFSPIYSRFLHERTRLSFGLFILLYKRVHCQFRPLSVRSYLIR